MGALALATACHARPIATSFDKWLENPFPPADGFSFPVGDGEGDGTYTGHADAQHSGWYVATRMGESYATGVDTGEEWSGRGGGDTHGEQPVMAIAAGKVVVARQFDNAWGLVVMIEHIVIDGHEKKRVRSQYAHLSRVDVHEGEIVRGRDVIGAIGKDLEETRSAYLHLEIRSDLEIPATYWPSDHGYDVEWIRRHYIDPSAFIRLPPTRYCIR